MRNYICPGKSWQFYVPLLLLNILIFDAIIVRGDLASFPGRGDEPQGSVGEPVYLRDGRVKKCWRQRD